MDFIESCFLDNYMVFFLKRDLSYMKYYTTGQEKGFESCFLENYMGLFKKDDPLKEF